MHKELCQGDLIGRNAGHTFSETIDGDMTLVEFKDDLGRVIARSQTMEVDDAYLMIRGQLGLGDELYVLTTAERDLLVPTEGTLIANSTTRSLNVYIGGAWR